MPAVCSSGWVGYDRGGPMRLSSSGSAMPIRGSYRATVPHILAELTPPAGVTFRDIDPESGMIWDQGCPGPVHEVFLDGTAPTQHCPRGFLGGIVRRVFFDSEHFDEPAAITFEKFREWANSVDRSRQNVEGFFGRLKRIFGKD